jgi:hypothetical protein
VDVSHTNSIITDGRERSTKAMLHTRPVTHLIQSTPLAQRDRIELDDPWARQIVSTHQRTATSKFEIFDAQWGTASNQRVFVAKDNHIYVRWFEFWSRATGGIHTGNVRAALPRKAMSAAQLRINQLTLIQSAFGLPIQTLAEVLSVSRAQIYKWLDISNNLTLQEGSHQRMSIIGRLATKWKELSNTPLSRLAREPLADGSTVLQRLCGETIDEAAAGKAFVELAHRLVGLQKSASRQMVEKGYTRRPSRRSLPSDE